MSDRQCRECTLCCKLLPVRELQKPANTVCEFQRAKGCSVYQGREFPASCALWSCHWLISDDDLPRPDRAHYVIDVSPDYIEVGDIRVRVVQIWIDPKHPNAHRDPKLRAWLERRYEKTGQVALVRFSSLKAIALFPPAFPAAHGKWVEKSGTTSAQHSARDIHDTYAAVR